MNRVVALTVMALMTFAAVAAFAADAPEPDLMLDAGSRSDLAVTVYNRDLALVREVRGLEVPKGRFTLEFRDVPERIEPRSLLVETGRGLSLNILEQNYEYDLMSRDKILEKYVGKEISWIQEDLTRVQGRLLGMSHGPIFEVDGEVVFEVPGRIALPSLPGNLRARPTLVWLADSRSAGTGDIEVNYLTRGMSWSADYVLEIAPSGREADLQAWVSLDNRCGATFDAARLLLVAGDIHQAPPPALAVRTMAKYAMDSEMGSGISEESLFDYHLYTLPGRTTLKDNSTKQVSLFNAGGLEVEKHYRLQSSPSFFNGGGGRISEPSVGIFYAFENEKENRLGIPLPAGVVRVYGESAAGERQLLGEDRISHTPRDERVELEVGKAFDIKAERTRTDYSRRGDRAHENAYRITLRNHKDEDVVVEVLESVGGDWRVLSSTHPHIKVDAGSLRFDLPVPADGETVLEYRVLVSY